MTLLLIKEPYAMNGKRYLLDTCTLIGLQKQTDQSLALLAYKDVYLSQCGNHLSETDITQ